MRKRTVVFLLCLVAVLGGVAAAAHTMGRSADAVAVTTTTQEGDPAVLKGLTACQKLQYGKTLLWDLKIPLAEPEETAVVFSREGRSIPAYNENAYLAVTLADPSQEGFYDEAGDSQENVEKAHPQMAPLLRQIASRTATGQTYTETVDPAQYLSGYFVWVTDFLPNVLQEEGGQAVSLPSFSQEVEQTIQDFFTFPFDQEDRWTVTVARNSEGLLTQMTVETSVPAPVMDTLYAVGDQAVYFTFAPNQETAAGLPDFCQVPGGYGIYRLSYAQGADGRFHVAENGLQMVYALDPQERVLNLALSRDESTLVLVSYREDQYVGTVLDTASMSLCQTVEIPGQSPWWEDTETGQATVPGQGECHYDRTGCVEVGERCLLFFGQEDYAVFLRGADGTYHYGWSAPIPPAFQNMQSSNVRGAWNGEKLALAFADLLEEEPGLVLMVYDDQGALLYHGAYTTTLNGLGLDWALVEERSYGAGMAEDDNVSPVADPALALTLTWNP